MPSIWNDKYLTGIKDIDEHHKKLATFVDQLAELKAQTTLDVRKANRSMVLLAAYAKAHFLYEEDWMISHGCHLPEKDKLDKEFVDFYQVLKTKSEETGVNSKLIEVLHDTTENWFINHMNIANKTISEIAQNKDLGLASQVQISLAKRQEGTLATVAS